MNLRHVAAYEDGSGIVLYDLAYQRPDFFRLHNGTRRRRLVEQEDPRAPHNRPGYGNGLAFPTGQLAAARSLVG
jgi:hypothetical protein